MDINNLRMGDLLYSDNDNKLLLVIEMNSSNKRKIVITWYDSCYMFDDKEASVERDYVHDVREGKYKVIGNLCDIAKGLDHGT
jgi:hypothetical protein